MAGHHVELSAVFADSQVAASETLRTRVTDAADEQKHNKRCELSSYCERMVFSSLIGNRLSIYTF